ncbi:thiamine biosynthesis protein [Coprinopsis marcescibilis]|uniref:Thiamine biosynthesis protein n=1 Tax=Coprinopsis marcescibilis TaxID=230819 RepID=A0A5C3L0D7_COPMA|nr:thiamine biosynthesis protein [Coprinopsis marcescibilis]
MSNYCAVLSIAGSDPSGGAGIQADLKTFAAHGCYGTCVITSLTAQNTTGVQGVHGIPPSFVGQQIRSVLDDINVKAMKTGMLFDGATASEVASILRAYQVQGKLPPIVCDPVCVSTSGHVLLQSDALEVLAKDLFPLTALITPNKSEAELLLSSITRSSFKISSLEDMLTAAETLASQCATAVLIKGGHIISSAGHLKDVTEKHLHLEVVSHNLYDENMQILHVADTRRAKNPEVVVDLLYQPGHAPIVFAKPRIDSTSTHGTGCTLSAAIACGIAQGFSLKDAVAEGIQYTYFGIITAEPIGSGYGPLNHLHSITPTVISKRTPSNLYPFTYYLIEQTKSHWKEYVQHDFVKQLGQGTLAKEKFVHFIVQDYHYLKYYTRSYGLLVAKSSTFPAIQSATKIIMDVLHEIQTHRTFCETFGVTREDLETAPEATQTTAYGAYILNIGLQGDAPKLIMALMACLLGYGEVGLWLKKEAALPNSWVVLDGNPYKQWIEDYSGEVYQSAVQTGLDTLEKLAIHELPSSNKLKEWLEIWLRCTQLERGFWDIAMDLRW